MRYALALSFIGMGSLLVYSSVKNIQPWDVIRAGLDGEGVQVVNGTVIPTRPTEQRESTTGNTVTVTPGFSRTDPNRWESV